MLNSTKVLYLTLAAYFDTGIMKYLWFVVVMVLYVVIVFANVLLIVVVCLNRRLHEPMYLFLCSLFVNEVFGSTGLFPFLLLQILSDVHTVSVPFCFLQVFCVFLYGNVELCTLTVMSYDRYVAICDPLQYNARMTFAKATELIALAWLFPLAELVLMMSLTARLQPCGSVINKVYCDNYSVVKLACSDTTVNNIHGLAYTTFIVVSVVTVILYTYLKILKVCCSASKQTRQKAVSTCSPQLLSLLNFSLGAFFEIIQSRFDLSGVPRMLRIFLSLHYLACQPLFNPVLYGLKMSKVHWLCRRLVFGKM